MNMTLFPALNNYCDKMLDSFSLISNDRKKILDDISSKINGYVQNDKELNLLFVCTHNSRRSQFAQVWAHLAINYFGLLNIHSFSCGSEQTIIHENTIIALESFGFRVQREKSNKTNFYFSDNLCIECFSKTFLHNSLPNNQIISLMTCDDADKNCPFIAGSLSRISLPYNDPKIYDDSSECTVEYKNTSNHIAQEIFYIFSKV
tara:strand:+ start:897 stop:1508 length:612 start_codon:yes stop_codon:yes gene_type:complete